LFGLGGVHQLDCGLECPDEETIDLSLYYFLLVILSLSCGSLPSWEIDVPRALAASMGLIAGWSLLSHVGARIVSQHALQGELEPLAAAGWIEKQLSAFRWLGLGVVVMCLAGFGLARMLDTLPYFAESMFLQACVLLLPGILIAAATWSAEHYYGVRMGYTDRSLRNYFQSLWMAFRSALSWLVIPILMLLGVGDLVAQLSLSPEWTRMLTLGFVVFFVTIGLPWLVRFLFKTSRIDPGYEAWIEQVLSAAGVRGTKPVRWDTNRRAFNAMIAGFVPSVRSLLLSDRLLDELPSDQLAMVVLHEAAHVRRRHIPLRMLSVLPAWGAGAALTRLTDGYDWAMILGSVVGILLMLLMLRVVAYRTEHDADVQACRIAAKISSQVDGVPATESIAAEVLSAALMRVTYDQPAGRGPTWLHPGVTQRIDHMRRACNVLVRETPQTNNRAAGTMANPA